MPTLLTAPTVCARLSLTKAHLRALNAGGLLRPVHLNQRVTRYRLADVEAFETALVVARERAVTPAEALTIVKEAQPAMAM